MFLQSILCTDTLKSMTWRTILIVFFLNIVFSDVSCSKDLKTGNFILVTVLIVPKQFRLKCLMEYILSCHKPPFNKWENIYWRNSCHPYVDFCHSLLKVWLNIKMHHHNGSDFDKNSLHVRTLLGRLCNIILECSSICICSRWLLDSIWLQRCFKRH